MAFNQERFDALIQKLETFANKQPHIYRLHVAFLATLGYAYIFLILGVTLALLAGIVFLMFSTHTIRASTLKVTVFLLAVALVLLRSLWVSFPPPAGLALKSKDVPGLFSVVNEISSKLKAPRFHHILLTDDFNAGVLQRPRLGLLGWHQNYLIIGLPLMLALSPRQFRAVLAHELGHLSGNHSRFDGWIYCQRQTWYHIVTGMRQGGNELSWIIFENFLKWYTPFFNAYSFVLARMDEYEADRCAVEIVGAQDTAEMLINVEVKARFLHNNFWSNIYNQVQTEIEPPKTTYIEMKKTLMQGISLQEGSFYLEQALQEKTNNEDTHPCLKDRLNALKVSLKQNKLTAFAPLKTSAARELLGESLENFLSYFNQVWIEYEATPWRQKYASIQQSLTTLKSLNEQAEKHQLTLEEAEQRALLKLEFEGEDVAIPLFREILNREPHHISANYLLGQILLNQNDTSGIEHIEKAIAQDLNIVIKGYQIIYSFLKQQGNLDKAQYYEERANQHYNLILLAKQERSILEAKDEFKSHNLPELELQKLSQQLSRYTDITTAYLAQKVVEYFPEKPLYVLGVRRKVSFLEGDYESENAQMVKVMLENIELSHDVFIFVLDNNHAKIEKKFKQLSDAKIYSRKK